MEINSVAGAEEVGSIDNMECVSSSKDSVVPITDRVVAQ
jgi:hypothetical protein